MWIYISAEPEECADGRIWKRSLDMFSSASVLTLKGKCHRLLP